MIQWWRKTLTRQQCISRLCRGSSHRSPKDGLSDDVRLEFCQEGKVSFLGRDLGGGKSCGQREEHGQRPEVIIRNSESIRRPGCLLGAGEDAGEGEGQPVRGIGSLQPKKALTSRPRWAMARFQAD